MPYIGKQPATISAVSVDTDTGTFSGQVAAASLDISGNVDVDGVLETDGISIASTVITASAADINLIDGITNGTVIASKAIITDANKDISGGRNITISGELDAATLDISGDADIDGTLEADAITVNGTALNTVIAGVTVANATLAATTTVTDSTANTNFPVVFHDESNALLDDTGALRYNPSTGELLVPKLTVAGVTTTADTVTMQAANAVVFEGATADAHETTLTITDPTADRTITLPNVSGTLPILAADSNTAITSTPAEINLLDGSVANTVVNSKAVIYGSSGELAGALSTAAQPNVTSLGTLTALTVDDITINGSTISDGGDLTLDVAGELSLDAGGGEIKFKDDGTVFGQIINSSTDLVVQVSTIDKDFIVKGKDDGSTITALTLDMSAAGTATFNHDIKLSADAIIDCGGNLRLDTESASVVFQDTGTVYGKVFQSSSDLVLKSEVNDKDIIFQGFDGGSTITALTLDMSDAGSAYFNSTVYIPQLLTHTGDTDTNLEFGTNTIALRAGNVKGISVKADEVVVNDTSADLDFRVESNGNANMLFVDGGNNVVCFDTTNTNPAENNVAGVGILTGGKISASADGNFGLQVNRKSSFGGVIHLRKDGTGGGFLALFEDSSAGRLLLGNDNTCLLFNDSTKQIIPFQSTGSKQDDIIALGNASGRFDQVFSANGSLNTSDRNEKQDIEELSDAEKRVAVRCKGLIRKYRWKKRVAEKGDNARIHVGLIAQDLQDAFTAEGLDATKYGMFCSDTWWDNDEVFVDDDGKEHNIVKSYYTEEEAPEGSTKRTRLAVRYSELLAFIISAI
jgi:cytoskeletal protein CcmA (bactofilin family)